MRTCSPHWSQAPRLVGICRDFLQLPIHKVKGASQGSPLAERKQNYTLRQDASGRFWHGRFAIQPVRKGKKALASLLCLERSVLRKESTWDRHGFAETLYNALRDATELYLWPSQCFSAGSEDFLHPGDVTQGCSCPTLLQEGVTVPRPAATALVQVPINPLQTPQKDAEHVLSKCVRNKLNQVCATWGSCNRQTALSQASSRPQTPDFCPIVNDLGQTESPHMGQEKKWWEGRRNVVTGLKWQSQQWPEEPRKMLKLDSDH